VPGNTGNNWFDGPAPVAVEVEPLSPAEEAEVLGPTGLAALGVSNVWLPDRGANIDCGTNEVELRPVVAPVSEVPVCVPVNDPPNELLDALPIGPAGPVRSGDKLDAVLEDPLRAADGTEDGAVRLGVAVEPRLVGDTPCVSAEPVDKPVPTVVFANVFAIGTHGIGKMSGLLGVCTVWLGWPPLPV